MVSSPYRLRAPPERPPDDEDCGDPDVLARPRALADWSNEPLLCWLAPENALSDFAADALDGACAGRALAAPPVAPPPVEVPPGRALLSAPARSEVPYPRSGCGLRLACAPPETDGELAPPAPLPRGCVAGAFAVALRVFGFTPAGDWARCPAGFAPAYEDWPFQAA